MKIHIAHLYYDLFNLYGENGNIKALKKEFENQGYEVAIHFLTLGDNLKFDEYDLVYMGASTENNQKSVIPHLLKYKKDIKKAIEENKFFLITGNSIELFGKYILNDENKKFDTLNIFSFYTEQQKKRLIGESIMKCSFVDKPIIGFHNQASIIFNNDKPMFEVIKRINYSEDIKEEGIKYNNFYGTYLLGPLLVRNHELLKYFISEIILTKNKKHKFKNFDLKLSEKAYEYSINRVNNNVNN